MSSALELFGWSIAATLLAGCLVPWVGCLLYVRRSSFHGIVLPQCAAAGIGCGFYFLPLWGEFVGWTDADVSERLAGPHGGLGYHLCWAGGFTFAGLAALLLVNRREGREVGRLAAVFALASAITVLAAQRSPIGLLYVDELMHGEILFLGGTGFAVLAVVLTTSVALLFWLRNDLTLVSFDRDTGLVLGLPVMGLEALLHAVTGVVITVGSLTVGPVVLFGLLVLPPVAARAWTATMGSFLALSALIGLASAALGAYVTLRFDLPLGACMTLAAGAGAGVGLLRGLSGPGGARARG